MPNIISPKIGFFVALLSFFCLGCLAEARDMSACIEADDKCRHAQKDFLDCYNTRAHQSGGIPSAEAVCGPKRTEADNLCADSDKICSLVGSWMGSIDEPEENSVHVTAGVCKSITTVLKWELTLSNYNPETRRGDGRMIITGVWHASYLQVPGLLNSEGSCFEKVTGDKTKTSAQRTETLDVVWEVEKHNRRRVNLSMRRTDCQGDACGRLRYLHSEADFGASGSLMYHRAGLASVRFERRTQ